MLPRSANFVCEEESSFFEPLTIDLIPTTRGLRYGSHWRTPCHSWKRQNVQTPDANKPWEEISTLISRRYAL